jgi:hypothetical protein
LTVAAEVEENSLTREEETGSLFVGLTEDVVGEDLTVLFFLERAVTLGLTTGVAGIELERVLCARLNSKTTCELDSASFTVKGVIIRVVGKGKIVLRKCMRHK